MSDTPSGERTAGLIGALAADYEEAFPNAIREQKRAAGSMVQGGSHTIRLFDPAPFRVVDAKGARLTDADDHEILDLWQGHYANILGHNPLPVVEALTSCLAGGGGLQTGIEDDLEIRFAEQLLRLTGAERLRFTTSGSLTTMYAVMLARAFTGRDRILKVGGGWHGAHPSLLKGVGYAGGWDHPDSAGLLDAEVENVLITGYNDEQRLEDTFRQQGDRIAAFIVEPWIGSGGFIAADPSYLTLARELTTRHGALLIFDEIISGFRFCPGPVSSLYGIQPDLATFAKIVGGGMPLAVVAGRSDVFALVERGAPDRVKFDGGTYSGHHLSLLAGITMVTCLEAGADRIYPAIGEMGARYRRAAEEAFAAEGIVACCTGEPNAVIEASSIGMIHFPHEPDTVYQRPEQVWDPAVSDVALQERGLKLALMLERVHVMHGMGAVSTAHTEDDLAWWKAACGSAARRFAQAR